MKSGIIKRSVVLAGHKSSVSLEDAFWNALKDIARERSTTLSALVGAIDGQRENGNLSSAIRLFVLDHFRTQAGSLIPAQPCGAAAQGTTAVVPVRSPAVA
jgi:predicted DNA-binding ribbon-helix-helix protein